MANDGAGGPVDAAVGEDIAAGSNPEDHPVVSSSDAGAARSADDAGPASSEGDEPGASPGAPGEGPDDEGPADEAPADEAPADEAPADDGVPADEAAADDPVTGKSPESPVAAGDPKAPEARQGEGDGAAAKGDGDAKAADGDEGSDGEKPADGDDGTADEAEDGKRPGKRKKRSLLRELLVVVVAALVLTILIKAFLVQVFSIPSASMENTLQINDRILVNRLVYHLRGVARGDVIVFSGDGSWGPEPPPASSNPVARAWNGFTDLVGVNVPGTDYVKRVIGLPGDHVVCCDAAGRVTVNGVALNEQSYLYPGSQPSTIKFNVTVPAGHVFVMGDNREDSADSRFHTEDPGGGSVPENEIVGRAFVIIWPPSRIGDLPIPETFKQAGLDAATAAVNYGPAAGGASAATAVLVWRRRRARRQL